MKRIALKFGLIAGAILSVMMFATIPFMDRIGYDNGVLIGYTTMVVAFLMVFFGIRSYRDEVSGGVLTFGAGFRVGLLITLIASVCYVISWQVIYYGVAPDYADSLAEKMMEKERSSGATGAELAAKEAEIAKFMDLYRNPLFNAAVTLIEVLPVGLIFTVISAAILRRRRPDGELAHA